MSSGKKKSTRQAASAPGTTRQAMSELDRIFHEKARLGILTTIIASPDELNFNEIKELCGLTDGNLNRHLQVLIDGKVLAVKKTGRGRNTNSQYRLTEKGRRQFSQYLQALETILNAAQSKTAPSNSTSAQRSSRNTPHRNDGLAPSTG